MATGRMDQAVVCPPMGKNGTGDGAIRMRGIEEIGSPVIIQPETGQENRILEEAQLSVLIQFYPVVLRMTTQVVQEHINVVIMIKFPGVQLICSEGSKGIPLVIIPDSATFLVDDAFDMEGIILLFNDQFKAINGPLDLRLVGNFHLRFGVFRFNVQGGQFTPGSFSSDRLKHLIGQGHGFLVPRKCSNVRSG